MFYAWLADLVLVLHLLFILFVVLGALLVFRWPGVMYLHVPAAAWGALIEFFGWVCPLTPLENTLRTRAGESAYNAGFIEHYLEPVIYPAGLTADISLVLGLGVVAVNLLIYGVYLARRLRG